MGSSLKFFEKFWSWELLLFSFLKNFEIASCFLVVGEVS